MAPTRARPLVLLIEDNLTHLDLYSLMLQDEVDVITATRGETGLALASVERPDAIIVDVLLPDADGLELCLRLRGQRETSLIPLVVLTGDDDAYDRAGELRSVVDAILKKPCPADRLLTTVQRAIAVRSVR
jgi:DNA-binding response OmpR family regulator